MTYLVKVTEGGLHWTGISDSMEQAFRATYRLEAAFEAKVEIWEIDGVGNERKLYDTEERERWSTCEP